jgi:predicted transcriptional regulator
MTEPDPSGLEEEASIFDEIDEEADARREAEAEADVAAGRVISHEAMKRWLLSWDTPNELPPPKCGE